MIWDVKHRTRAGDTSDIVRPIVLELLSRRFSTTTILYTDGSKSDSTVGSGIYGNGMARAIGLPEQCSVFSAEAYALKIAVNTPNIANEIVLLSDSASCLTALESGHSKYPWIQQIEQIVRFKNIQFCWIPGHAGVRGNEFADQLANEGRNRPPENIAIPASDAFIFVKNQIREHWNRKWFSCRDVKLREIKACTKRWTDRSNT